MDQEMDSAARRQKLLETAEFEPAASAVTVCGKTDGTLPCLILPHSGSGIRPPQAVPASITINDECLPTLSQPDRNQLLRRLPKLTVDEIGCQAAHQR